MEKFNEYSYLPTRHLQSFWGASGDFWQAQWDKFIDKFGKFAKCNKTKKKQKKKKCEVQGEGEMKK